MAYSISASIEFSVPSTICSTIGSTGVAVAQRRGRPRMAAVRSMHVHGVTSRRRGSAGSTRMPCGSTSSILAGKHHGRRAELLDHGRPVEPAAGRQRRAVIDRRVAERAVEIDRRGSTFGAGVAPRACASFGMLRPLDQAEAGDAEIDQFDLLLARIIVAEGALVRGVEGVDQRRRETPRRPRRRAPARAPPSTGRRSECRPRAPGGCATRSMPSRCSVAIASRSSAA